MNPAAHLIFASFQPTLNSGWRIGPALLHSLRLNDFSKERDRN